MHSLEYRFVNRTTTMLFSLFVCLAATSCGVGDYQSSTFVSNSAQLNAQAARKVPQLGEIPDTGPLELSIPTTSAPNANAATSSPTQASGVITNQSENNTVLAAATGGSLPLNNTLLAAATAGSPPQATVTAKPLAPLTTPLLPALPTSEQPISSPDIVATGSSSSPPAVEVKPKASRRLLSSQDFRLIGRFVLPDGTSGLATTRYSAGGMSIGDEGAAPTIFVVGRRGVDIAYGGDPNVHVGEVRVPSILSLSAKFDELPSGTFKQPMSNALEGHIGDVFDPSTPNNAKLEIQVRGVYKYGNDLLINALMFYDNNNVSVAGHFSRPANLAVSGLVKGPVRVAPQVGARHTPGPMFAVPRQLQQQYGWLPVASNLNGVAIAGTASNGPTLILYDPEKIKSNEPRASIPGQVLASYPYPGKTFAEAMGYRFYMADGNPLNQNPWWTPVNHTRGGGAWPETHETVVFAGLRGLGAPYYGDPKNPPSWGAKDPLTPYFIPHAYPYQHVIYLVDQEQYVAVHNGSKKPHEVQAYEVFELPDPFGPASTQYSVCGSAHDTVAKRLYIMKCWPSIDTGQSLIEVYQLPN